MDWVKLLLARIATALFWFNPLVWMLAREAHQLREETADDAVLAADIADTDYAQLLVGVARHECPGLLLGAHGVAPSKSSLARRVARVLDGKSVRGPVARSFALGVFVGAVLVAAPLAALTLDARAAKPRSTPRQVAMAGETETGALLFAGRRVPTDLPHIIANGVSTSVAAAVAAAAPATPVKPMTAQEARARRRSRRRVAAAGESTRRLRIAPGAIAAVRLARHAHGRRPLHDRQRHRAEGGRRDPRICRRDARRRRRSLRGSTVDDFAEHEGGRRHARNMRASLAAAGFPRHRCRTS